MPRKAGHPVSSAVRNCGKQVVPVRICFFYQSDFLRSIPLLEPLFPTDRAFDIAELLEVNQAMDAVSFGEAVHDFRSMLEHSPNKIACDADIVPPILLARMYTQKIFSLLIDSTVVTGSPACAGDDSSDCDVNKHRGLRQPAPRR
jgi:hypothetical protein